MEFLFTTESGHLHSFNLETKQSKLVFDTESRYGGCMGIIRHEGFTYVSGIDTIFKLDGSKVVGRSNKVTPRPDFHHMIMYDDHIYITATIENSIKVFNKDLRLVSTHVFAPPKDSEIEYKVNYNHLNGIFKQGDNFYVNLNWFTGKQYGMSGLIKTDLDFNEIGRFEYGWESHDFQIVDGKKYVICGTSGSDKEINHPAKSGILVDGELFFEHDHKKSFCKALHIDDNFVLLGGGSIEPRGTRQFNKAVLYVIDRNTFGLRETIYPEMAGIKGIVKI